VTTDSVTLTDVHTGRLGFAQAAKLGRFSIAGPRDLARALPSWGGVYGFATVTPAGLSREAEGLFRFARKAGLARINRRAWSYQQRYTRGLLRYCPRMA
jgi:hypothetical protein